METHELSIPTEFPNVPLWLQEAHIKHTGKKVGCNSVENEV